jgi:hypothetical protein
MKTYSGLLLFIFSTTMLLAQLSEEDVRARLDMIHNGKIDQVRSEVVSLKNQYPDDPGVLYLDAYVTVEGSQAVKKYQSLVDNFPKNVWADDALYKVYQYYYSIGLYKTADHKLEQLNRDYPNSIYAKKEGSPTEKVALVPVETAKPETTEPAFQPEPSKVQPVVQSEPAATQQAVPAQTSSESAFMIQVGVYSQESSAQRQSALYTQKVGRQATVFQKQSNGKTMYAVGFGGFANEQDARTFGAEIKSKYNMDWFLVK